MESAQALVDRWQNFANSAVAELRLIPADAWGRPSGYEGWTAHDLLAHVGSTQQATSRLVESAFAEAPSGPTEPFDENRWNASQIRRRRGLPEHDLIEELRAGAAELVRTVRSRVLAPADLQRPVPAGAGRGHRLQDVLEELLDHQRNHLSDLLSAVRD